jgi:oligoribonuclease (3'-5' exoribonuclease)
VEDFELSDEQKDEIIEAAALVDESRLQEIVELVKDQVIHNGNYKSSLAKLQREAK